MNNAKYTSASARLGENNFKPRKLRRGRIQLPETGSDVSDSKPSSCTWGKGGAYSCLKQKVTSETENHHKAQQGAHIAAWNRK